MKISPKQLLGSLALFLSGFLEDALAMNMLDINTRPVYRDLLRSSYMIEPERR